MLNRIARLAVTSPRRVVVVAALLAILIGVFGIPVADKLSPSGFQDPTAESSRTARILTEKFDQGDVPLVVVVSAPDGYDSPQAQRVAQSVIERLTSSGHVAAVNSAWTSPPSAAAAMVSSDRKAGRHFMRLYQSFSLSLWLQSTSLA